GLGGPGLPRPPPPPKPPPAAAAGPPAPGAPAAGAVASPGNAVSLAPAPRPPRAGPPSAVVPPPVPALAPTSTCAKIVDGLARKIEIAMRPYSPSFGFGHPGPSSRFHVSPPSVDFHSPLPGPPPL